MDKRNELLARVYIVMMFFVFLSFWIIAKVFYVNIIEGEKWRKKIDNNVKWKVMEGDRGNIYSADGNILAASSPLFDVRMDLLSPTNENFNKNIDSLSYCISKYIRPDKSAWQWKSELKKGRKEGKNKTKKGMSYYLIKRDLRYEELMKIKEFPLFRLGQVKGGLIVERKTRRIKPFQEMAGRTVGIDRENSSKIGIEGSYNQYLKGETIRSLMKKIPGGYWIPLQEIDNINLAKGADIISNLDIRIQDIVHEEIMKQLSITKSEAGVGIVMEVKTGKIVAMTNLSAGKDSIYKENKNYAISQKYAPGSVMKGATVLALLDDGFMKADDLVDIENGRKSFRGDVVRDDENFAHGRPVTFRDALVHSSNVAMAKLSNQFYNQSLDDRKRFINKIKSFGLGRLTGIDLIGEVAPVIKDPVKNKDDFYYTTIPWMAHGYETEYTPIQVLSFYNTIANNGRMMKPYLVDKIVKHEETIDIKPEIVIEKIASDQAITTLRGFLEGVVLEGTATKLKEVGVRIAGKTGTAQVGIPVEGQDMEYNSTFAGYFPAHDPKYSIIVVFYRNPKHLYYASQVAVPVVKNIIEKILSLQAIDVARKTTVIKRSVASSELPDYGLGYSRDFKAIFNHSLVPFKSNGNSRWTEIQGDGRNIVAKAHKYQKNMVPDVTNMGVRDAIYILESLGLNVKTEGYGKVVKQSVEPGSQLNKQKILLTLE